jgi:hypothetical protein
MSDISEARRFPTLPALRRPASTLAVIFVLLAVLAFLFPPTGDDWSWGSQEGAHRFHTFFAGYNGRYMGNLAVLLLTRTPWLSPFVVALTLCLILQLLVTITGTRTWAGYLGAAALVVAMPLDQWRQTVVWLSGFTNYTLATLCLLVLGFCIQQTWAETPWTRSRLAAAVVLPFAFASALFIEHVTILIVLASLLQVAALVRAKRLNLLAVSWATGSVIGGVAMFSNSAYRKAAGGTSGYQGIGGSHADTGSTGVVAMIKQGAGGVSQYAITGNTVLNAALFLAVLGLALATRNTVGSLTRLQIGAVATGAIGVVLGAAVNASVDAQHYFGSLTSWSWLPGLGLLSSILITAGTLVEDRSRARLIYVLTAATVALIVPMAAVTPYGPRNFLPTYVLMVAIALTLFAELVTVVPAPVVSGVVIGLGASTVLVVLAGYFVAYSQLNDANNARVEYLREAASQGKKSPAIFEMPFLGYLHSPDPVTPGQQKAFKRFYGLPQDMRIRLFPRG